MEEKKKIRLISSNSDAKGNRVDASEEELTPNSARAQHAKELIIRAAEIHKPLEADYLGSAVVHFYKRDILANQQSLFVACQTNMEGVTDEQHASLGWAQLRSAMMKRWGRKDPKTTK